MNKYYYSFGQSHTHRITHNLRAVTIDCDSIVEVIAEDMDAARDHMFNLFGQKWSMQYTLDSLDLNYFPRGVVLTFDLGSQKSVFSARNKEISDGTS